MRTKSAIETKYLQKESRARLQSLNRIYGQSTSELDEQIWKVRKQLEIEVLANRESEEFLKRKVVSLQKDAGDWMQRYETDFEELEKEHETLNAQRTEDLVKLNDYTERYTKEMEEKARREEEARIREEMEALRKQEEERNTWAATTVQKLWRGHLARTGGGGKKGKKGKKGKGSAAAKKAKGVDEKKTKPKPKAKGGEAAGTAPSRPWWRRIFRRRRRFIFFGKKLD